MSKQSEKCKTAVQSSSGPETQRTEETQTVDLGDGVKLELIWCPPGTFMMGNPEGKEDRFGRDTLHQVTLTKGYWLGKYPVTQRQWKAIAGEPLSECQESGWDSPVGEASWVMCQEFIEQVNAQIPGGGFRFPTEAEWEFAARGGSESKGFLYSGSNDLDAVGWYKENSHGRAHSVGQKGPNELGFYDMSGNVYEWCQDVYGDYPSENVIDPVVPDPPRFNRNLLRVCRGGCSRSEAQECCLIYHIGSLFWGHEEVMGLRLARDEKAV